MMTTFPRHGAGLLSGSSFVDHDELMRRSGCCASGLADLGVGHNDAVALLLRNEVTFFVASFGVAAVGARVVPVNWQRRADEVVNVISHCGARVLIGHTDLLRAVRHDLPADVRIVAVSTPIDIADAYGIVPAPTAPGDVEWATWMRGGGSRVVELRQPRALIFTAGTTGRPKAVERAANSGADLEAPLRQILGIGPAMRTVISGPLYHAAPNAHAFAALASGALVVVPARLAPDELLSLIERHGISHLHLVPTMFIRLLRLDAAARRRHEVSSLRHVVHAGAPCPPDVKRAMIDWWGPIIWEYYGTTEIGAVTACSSAEWLAHPGTVGRPLKTAVVRVHDRSGRSLPAAATGEVVVQLGERTDFVSTGDLGYFDADGYLHLRDRVADVITIDGVDIYPSEIEACLISMRGIRDCAVFGIPDVDHGQIIAAAVELDPGATVSSADVQRYVWLHLATYKTPRVVTFHDALPREDTGKLFKRQLRAPFWAAGSGGSGSAGA